MKFDWLRPKRCFKTNKRKLTVEIAGVLLVIKHRYEFSFLPQQGVPVHILEEGLRAHLDHVVVRAQSLVRLAYQQQFDDVDGFR